LQLTFVSHFLMQNNFIFALLKGKKIES